MEYWIISVALNLKILWCKKIARKLKEVGKNAIHDFEYIISCGKIIYIVDNINGPVLSGCELSAYKK